MSIADVQVGTVDGTMTTLSSLRGRVTLLVVLGAGERTAEQVPGWQALHASVRARGATLLGVPTAAFGDLGGNAAAERRFAVITFPLTGTVPLEPVPAADLVDGQTGYSVPDPAELFVRLREELPDLVVDEGTAVLADGRGVPRRWWPGSAGPNDADLVAGLEAALPPPPDLTPRARRRPRATRPTAS